ncbi:glycosyltransferase [Rhizorhapis sp. SPR117]|uniref:glycosyltransferase n=1 Tax=Rhizorhapis sp. SPR117 TaxID=2912611 RepID=UPI001F16072A|nr:glycosyltransferase [Rhizorhapis sp. SPR117]
MLTGGLLAFLEKPKRALEILGALFDWSKPKLILRNLSVYPKGLWLSREIARLNVQHVHAHWIAVPATMATIAARMADVSLSITAHRYDIAQGNLVPWKFASSIFVRAIDGRGASELIMQLPAGEPKRPEVIHMGVEEVMHPVPIRPGPLTSPRGLIGARLIALKGHSVLFKAIVHARTKGTELTLDVFGDGPQKGRLRTLAVDLGIENLVNFCGVVSHEELLVHIRSGYYDIALLTSITAAPGDREGIPVFLMEAMAAGLPPIATSNGGIVELIDGKNGLLVPERDEGALADAIIRLAGDEQLRRNLAAQARNKIAGEFSITASAARLRELINKNIVV